MDIDRARYFCTFAQTGSLAKASTVLRISQPALSRALKLLQQEVGLKLLEPEGRGLRLTEAGTRFKATVEPLITQWLGVPAELRSDSQQLRPARMASFEVFTTYFLRHWLKHAPEIQGLDVHEHGPGRIEEAVAAGHADFGVTYIPIPKAGIEFEPTGRILMGIYGQARFKRTPLAELPFVIPIQPLQGTPSKVQGLDGWPDHKLPRQVAYRVTMMESAIQICLQGFAVAYLPEFVAKLHNATAATEFQLIELPCPLSRAARSQSVYLVQRAGSTEGAVVRSVAKALRGLK